MTNQNNRLREDPFAPQKNFIKETLNPIIKDLQEKYVIESGARAEAIIDYLVKLFAKHQDWKNARLLRYTVDYFNLQPKPKDETNQIQGA
jgi:hypothetical protein